MTYPPEMMNVRPWIFMIGYLGIRSYMREGKRKNCVVD